MHTFNKPAQTTPTVSFEPASEEELALRSVEMLIRYIGEDPNRDGLKDTPKRVLKALKEMTAGYNQDPKAILAKTFDVDISPSQMIVLDSIHFNSICEHHMLPFTGTAAVGYIPDPESETGVVGVSKLGRLVLCYAARLQVQERMTEQIANSLDECLNPRGVAVVVKAMHSCMSCRGVQLKSNMVTSTMRGIFETDRELRQDFFAHIKQ